MKTRHIESYKRGIDEENRTVTFVASTSAKDAHGTVLNADGWDLKRFNANPIIGYQHNVHRNESPDDIIAKGYSYIEKGELLTDMKFKPPGRSEKADKVWEDIGDGFLNAVSVGFIPIGDGVLKNDETGKEVNFNGWSIPEGHTYYYEGQELLEVSVVNIPSNPEALKKALRSIGKEEIDKILADDTELPENDNEPDDEGYEDVAKLLEIENDKLERDRLEREIIELQIK